MVAITHPNRTIVTVGTLAIRPSAATYRRRRLVAATLAVLIVLSLILTASRLLGGPSGAVVDARPVAELSVVVEPGDSVWSIAESLAGGGDVRPVVDAIVAANGGADLVVGDRLELTLPDR